MLAAAACGPAAAQIGVEVNGQPVSFHGARPQQINGRVFIPLRSVGETLGAQIRWEAATRTAYGTRGGRSFSLPLGSRTAFVDGRTLRLDAPARLRGGETMVPLRFVAEALGADVAWRPANQLVAINLEGQSGVAGERQSRVVVPEDTVVRVKLADDLDSRNARRGDRVAARLDEDDRSRFPMGTRFEGRITEVQRSTKDRPGLLDMTFDRAVLPDGTSVPISGTLASLDKDSVVRTSDGRLTTSRKAKSSKFDWKWVGIGAAGGAVLGTIFGGATLKGVLLGGAGGAIYSYLNKNKKKDYRDVELSSGTEFGIRLNDRVAFAERDDYRYR
jgi:hypothetical protein